MCLVNKLLQYNTTNKNCFTGIDIIKRFSTIKIFLLLVICVNDMMFMHFNSRQKKSQISLKSKSADWYPTLKPT